MTQLVLSLGSNIERRKYICYGLRQLRDAFGELTHSPVYETAAVGFSGPDFYNMVVAVQTEIGLDDVIRAIQAIEAKAGRVRGSRAFNSRNLDIDVLLYGDADLRTEGRNVPRDEINHAAYVLKPLADILPQALHPVSGSSFGAMWAAFRDDQQVLRRVQFNFDA